MSAFLAALGFLTRIPVPARVWRVPGVMGRALPFYPWVGAGLGGVLLLLHWGLHALGVPPLLAGGLLLAVWVGLTGALHLDGLADSADAWVGGIGSREKTLAIMKDPAAGPMGVVALVLLLLLKFAALASLAPALGVSLLLAPLLARTALVLAFLTTPYVRSGGLGSALAQAPRGACVLSLLAALALPFAFGLPGLVAWLAMWLVFVLWRRAVVRRLQGFTGDTAGALAELIELAVLLAMSLAPVKWPDDFFP